MSCTVGTPYCHWATRKLNEIDWAKVYTTGRTLPRALTITIQQYRMHFSSEQAATNSGLD